MHVEPTESCPDEGLNVAVISLSVLSLAITLRSSMYKTYPLASEIVSVIVLSEFAFADTVNRRNTLVSR